VDPNVDDAIFFVASLCGTVIAKAELCVAIPKVNTIAAKAIPSSIFLSLTTELKIYYLAIFLNQMQILYKLLRLETT
jgi:hypothetical protein